MEGNPPGELMETEHQDFFAGFKRFTKPTPSSKRKTEKGNWHERFNDVHKGISALVASANISTDEDQEVLAQLNKNVQDIYEFIEQREKLLASYEERFNHQDRVIAEIQIRLSKVEAGPESSHPSMNACPYTDAARKGVRGQQGQTLNIQHLKQSNKQQQIAPEAKKQHVVIIEPKNNNVNKIARAALIDLIEKTDGVPDEALTIKVSANGKKGIIVLDTKEQAEALTSVVNTWAGNEATARPPIENGSVFALFGIETEKELENINDNILKSNAELLGTQPELNVFSARAMPDGTKKILMRAKGQAEIILNQTRKLKACCQIGFLKKSAQLTQCFRCSSFGHAASSKKFGDCKKKPECPICAEEHERQECKFAHDEIPSAESINCANCKHRGLEHKGHSAIQNRCPIRKATLERFNNGN